MAQWINNINTRLTFGKHKGVSFKHLPKDYRAWAIKNKAIIIKGDLMADAIIKVATNKLLRNKTLNELL